MTTRIARWATASLFLAACSAFGGTDDEPPIATPDAAPPADASVLPADAGDEVSDSGADVDAALADTAPRIVQTSRASSNGANQLTIPIPDAVTAGHLVIVGMTFDTGSLSVRSMTDDVGNVFQRSGAETQTFAIGCSRRAEIWSANDVKPGGTKVVANFSASTKAQAWVIEAANVTKATAPDKTGRSDGENQIIAFDAPPVEPSRPLALVVSVGATCSTIQTVDPASGFTNLPLEPNNAATAWRIVSEPGLYGARWFTSSPPRFAAATAAFIQD